MNEITHCDRWPRLWSRNEHIKEAIDVIFIAFANIVLLQLHESYAYLLRVTSHHVIFISLSEVTLPQASASDFKYNRVILERAAGRAGSGGPSSRHGPLPVWNRSGQAVDQVYIYPYALRRSVRDNTLHAGRRIRNTSPPPLHPCSLLWQRAFSDMGDLRFPCLSFLSGLAFCTCVR